MYEKIKIILWIEIDGRSISSLRYLSRVLKRLSIYTYTHTYHMYIYKNVKKGGFLNFKFGTRALC